MSQFHLSGIEPRAFEPLFELDDDELARRGAARRFASADFGYPCRVSLVDARVGEELLLLPYTHQAAASPYRASGPIFVRRGAQRCVLPPGVVPPYVTRRLISWRAYDAADEMVDAGVEDGTRIGDTLATAFANAAIAYIHLHNAKRGCFSCLARRVD